MKDTLIPLDILFFSPLGQVVDLDSMTPCPPETAEGKCPNYTTNSPASYALEVTAGFIEEHGVDVGWQLALPTQ